MKSKNLLFIITLFIILISIGIFAFRKQAGKYERILERTPYLLAGEKILCFDLIDQNGNTSSIKSIENSKVSLIFIFEEPCSPCNKNLVFWKRISAFYSAHVTIYGIVLKEYKNLKDTQNSIMPNFKLFAPVDMKSFRKKMKAESKLAQTILINGNTIHYIKVDNLESIDYFEIVKIINKEIK